jgi:hypothetical protein
MGALLLEGAGTIRASTHTIGDFAPAVCAMANRMPPKSYVFALNCRECSPIELRHPDTLTPPGQFQA